MAFKRVLSVLMVVLVLISTLCAFKPIETNFEPLRDNVTAISVPPVVSFDFSFSSIVGTLMVQWDNGYETYTGGKGESDVVRSLSTVTRQPIEYPDGMFKYNFKLEMGVYTTTYFYIKVYDNLSDFPNGPIKSYYSLKPYIDNNSQTVDKLDIFVDSDDYVFISSPNEEVTSTLNNEFLINVYVNYSTLGQQYTNGFNVGFKEGSKNTGDYQQGYHEGRADGIAGGFYGMFTDPIGALLNFVIVPVGEHGGITLGSVFLVLIAISLIVIYLKYFAGG